MKRRRIKQEIDEIENEFETGGGSINRNYFDGKRVIDDYQYEEIDLKSIQDEFDNKIFSELVSEDYKQENEDRKHLFNTERVIGENPDEKDVIESLPGEIYLIHAALIGVFGLKNALYLIHIHKKWVYYRNKNINMGLRTGREIELLKEGYCYQSREDIKRATEINIRAHKKIRRFWEDIGVLYT